MLLVVNKRYFYNVLTGVAESTHVISMHKNCHIKVVGFDRKQFSKFVVKGHNSNSAHADQYLNLTELFPFSELNIS